MKLSLRLADDDVDFLDRYANNQGYDSRSAVVRRAIRLLRSTELGDAYADAWSEWSNSDDATVWDGVGPGKGGRR